MATLEALEKILCGPDGGSGLIRDKSYFPDIDDYINDAVTAIAGGIRMPDGAVSPPLPDLFSTDTVDTSTSLPYVSLPSDYQRNVVMVVDSNGDKVAPPFNGGYYAFSLFLSQAVNKALDQEGSVDRVCVKGSNLYYQDIPSESVELTVHYYRSPTDMSDPDDTVDGIPEHLQKKLIKHYVCREIFGEGIEDGEDSEKSGYRYHTQRFYEAMTDLIDFVGIDAEPEFFGCDESEYDFED